VGAAAVSRAELESALGRLAASSSKFRSFEELPALSMDLRGAGHRIVLTNGCFDLLHTGHIMLFQEAKRHGDVLIVAVDDDASVTAVKGPGRPVIGQDQRIRLLSALDAVDYVTLFSQGQLDALVRAVGPDVLLKGSNYEGREIIGREAVEAAGGQVVFAPTIDGLSADAIIDHIRRGESAA
jgi:D-beta-D-heptose 7-phosphate kinase/D-beta-D-heptose 1-phosphate adenosyltransferase